MEVPTVGGGLGGRLAPRLEGSQKVHPSTLTWTWMLTKKPGQVLQTWFEMFSRSGAIKSKV